MNFSSLLAIGTTGLSLLLALWLFISGMLNGSQQARGLDQQQELLNHQTEFAKLQQEAQIQQQQIQAGQRLQEQGTIILKEMAAVTLPPKKNTRMESLLKLHKITVQPPEATPAPVAPASPVAPAVPAVPR